MGGEARGGVVILVETESAVETAETAETTE